MRLKRHYILILILLLLSVPVMTAARPDTASAADNEIVDIGVNDVDGTTEIEIKSSSPFTYTIYRPSDPYTVVVDLQDTGLGIFTDRMMIDKAGVREIVPSVQSDMPGVARLRISLTVPADVEPIYNEESLIIAFDNPEAADVPVAETEVVEEEPGEPVASVETAAEERDAGAVEIQEEPETGTGPIEQKEYVGEKISLDFQDAELSHVFRLLADVSGYNIVVSPDVRGKFSMKLIDVPWDQALDVILRNYGLSKSIEGNIIRIAPTSVLAQEEEAIAQAKESQEKAGDLVTVIYPINYANVDDIKSAIIEAKILTKRGFIGIDERTTSVIIKDVEQKHAEYEALINALDVPTPQLSIDARFVEVTSNFTEEFGVRWGLDYRPIPQVKVASTGAATETSTLTLDPFAVNLPASIGKGAGGEIGIGFIGAGALRSLDLQLSALELSGKGKIISNPRIITMDNQQAVIQQGKKIPYQTVSDEGTKTEFVDAALVLTVTPHITPHGTILMDIEAKKNEANFSQTSAGGVPTIDTNEVSTQVLIKDGDTIALGGIFKATTSNDESGIPGISKVPGLGWLFKNKQVREDTTEILIFITPRIVNEG